MEQTIAIIKFCREIPKQIKLNTRIMSNLEDQYYLPSAGERDGTHGPKNKISKVTETLALNIPDGVSSYIKELEEKNKSLHTLHKEIMREIQSLEYREQKVIIEFYLNGYSWERIAIGFYSVRQCKNIRTEALKKLKIKFEENPVIKRASKIKR